MDSEQPSAATRVSENSFIMSEVFSWVEKKKDLRSCLVMSRDSFVNALKPLFEMVPEGITGSMAGKGCPLVSTPVNRFVEIDEELMKGS